MMTAKLGTRRYWTRSTQVMVVAGIIALGGCADQGLDDLRQFTENAYKDRKPQVEPLPKIRPHETFVYTASSMTDPFSAGNLNRRKPPPVSGVQPDEDRRKEPLEQYPLDSLRMVGSLFREDVKWAVIRAPDGTVHRARPGNYIGQSFGVITDITEADLSVKELIQDPNGNWIERLAGLSTVR